MEDLILLISNSGSGLWAMLAIFVILLICGFGLPIPEDLLLFAAGYLVYEGVVELPVAIGVCFLGIILGDSLLFLVGNRFGLTIFENRWFRRVINRKRLRLSRRYFATHGKRIIFAARFMAGLRAPIFLSAAILRMRFWHFILIDGLAALISVPLLVYGAYYFGAEIDQLGRWIKGAKLTLVASLVLAAIVWWIWHKRRKANPPG